MKKKVQKGWIGEIYMHPSLDPVVLISIETRLVNREFSFFFFPPNSADHAVKLFVVTAPVNTNQQLLLIIRMI